MVAVLGLCVSGSPGGACLVGYARHVRCNHDPGGARERVRRLPELVGADSVRVVADKVQVSQRWMIPFGVLLASGAAGLVTGFAVPVLGTAAAVGLVLYFVCALSAHVRVRDPKIAGAVSFLALAAAALIADLGYHNHW